MDRNGNLYGTAFQGGAGTFGDQIVSLGIGGKGYGIVFGDYTAIRFLSVEPARELRREKNARSISENVACDYQPIWPIRSRMRAL